MKPLSFKGNFNHMEAKKCNEENCECVMSCLDEVLA
jgi:hypothetical protein